ncbi:chromate transporter, partial [Sphingomonas sp.]|uniref:chromate transporter n=1 Tax=Sphingomonas sp. TaxID=28214 RepID=UPI00333EA066
MSNTTAPAAHGVPLVSAVRVWVRIAALSFGGPAGQIAVMHRILVEEKRWIGEQRFLHALNYCMLLPGPEAQQLAIYIGWLMHRTVGGVIAGVLFVLPGIVSIMALSWIYALYGATGVVAGLFFGLKAAVLAIVAQAVVRIGRRSLGNRVLLGVAAVAFLLIFFFAAPFPLIVLGAGVLGYVATRAGRSEFRSGGHGGGGKDGFADADSALGEALPDHARAAGWRALKVPVVCALAWGTPVVALLLAVGPENVFTRIALFFSGAAMVTFGGAYAVLGYVAQAAVQDYHWLRPGEMLDGLGMAETTPGPLIMVLQFVGFMGAYRDAGAL